MNLTRLFLESLPTDISADSVKTALISCENEMQQLANFDDEEETVRILFGESNDLDFVSDVYSQLMDLKSVYQKYDRLLSPSDKQELWILNIIEEATELYEYRQNRKLLAELTTDELSSLESLCFEIEKIYNAKYIQFIAKDKAGLNLQDKIEMTTFEKAFLSSNYITIQNHLIETMRSGGLAYVVAGSIGLTPQRLHGFILSQNNWCKCQAELSSLMQDIILGKAKAQ